MVDGDVVESDGELVAELGDGVGECGGDGAVLDKNYLVWWQGLAVCDGLDCSEELLWVAAVIEAEQY